MSGPGLEGRLQAYAASISGVASEPALPDVLARIRRSSEAGRKTLVVGNGGSAAVASHVTTDLAKTAGLRVLNLNDPGLITCFANDYGYGRWVAEALERHVDEGDVVILISSSGRSENVLEGAQAARTLGAHVITLSGFDADNPLRGLGDLSLWVDSSDYNIVEITHLAWLLAVVDVIAAGVRG